MEKLLLSRKLNAGLILVGLLVFSLPYLQLPGLALLLIGGTLNLASGRPYWQKGLWLLPVVYACGWVTYLYAS